MIGWMNVWMDGNARIWGTGENEWVDGRDDLQLQPEPRRAWPWLP